MQMCFYFGSDWLGWTIIIKEIKWPECLWSVVTRSLILISFTYSSWRTVSVKIKNIDQTHQYYDPGSWRFCSAHFPPGFSPGLRCQQNVRTWPQHLWKNHQFLVKLFFSLVGELFPIITGTWYEHLTYMPVIMCSVTKKINYMASTNEPLCSLGWHCFTPPNYYSNIWNLVPKNEMWLDLNERTWISLLEMYQIYLEIK